MAEPKKPRERRKIFIKPADGLRIKDPETFQVLAKEGEYKTHSTYWQRRILDGDVLEVPTKHEAKKGKE